MYLSWHYPLQFVQSTLLCHHPHSLIKGLTGRKLHHPDPPKCKIVREQKQRMHQMFQMEIIETNDFDQGLVPLTIPTENSG